MKLLILKELNLWKIKFEKEFSGQISWVISAWVFVSLENTVEWFIPKEKFGKNAVYNEDLMNFYNPVVKQKFTLWDKIKIKVESVQKENGKIYFDLV